jgi:hypothetical protein
MSWSRRSRSAAQPVQAASAARALSNDVIRARTAFAASEFEVGPAGNADDVADADVDAEVEEDVDNDGEQLVVMPGAPATLAEVAAAGVGDAGPKDSALDAAHL